MNIRASLILLSTCLSLPLFSQDPKRPEDPVLSRSNDDALIALNKSSAPAINQNGEKDTPDQKELPMSSLVGVLHQATLLGDWSGVRSEISGNGVDILLNYKSDNLYNIAGGLNRGNAFIHNIDLALAVDAEKSLGWPGGSMLLHFLINNGGKLNPSVGDAQMVSNIEGVKTAKLYEFWIQQLMMGGSLSFLTGLYDLNTEFYVTRSSGLFINGSHGVGKEFSQTGQNGPSIFPNTALAFRAKVQFVPDMYVLTAVIDGTPGEPTDPYATSFHTDGKEGALLVAEVGYSMEEGESDASYAKIAVGAWHYTSSFSALLPDQSGECGWSTGNSGMYVLAEKKMQSPGGASNRGLAIFARGGLANGTINKFDYHVGVGAAYTGLFPGREDDTFGIAIAHAHAGTSYKTQLFEEGSYARYGELAIELTYRAQLTPWLAVQPNIQQITQPSACSNIRDAMVVGSRFEVKF